MIGGGIIFRGVLVIVLMKALACKSIDRSELNTKLNLFTSDINQHLFRTDNKSSYGKTLIWSPLSTYGALLPLLHAAKGSTKSELENILHFSKSEEQQTNLFKKGSRSEDKTSNGLKTATGLFLSNDYELNENFMKSLESTVNYGLYGCVELQRMDLSQKSRSELAYQVNHWVNVSTDAIIQQIVQPDAFNMDTKLILVNAVEFKAKWRSAFQPSDTKLQTFYGSEGSSKVPMMFQRNTQDFGKFKIPSINDEFQVLKLGYEKNDLKLLLILPNDPLTLPKVLNEVMNSSTKLSEVIEQLEPTELDIYLPKFKIESDVPIKSALQKAGLKKLFSRMEANLTEMINVKGDLKSHTEAQSSPLYLNDLIQKTVFEVDESGTKAGAATAGLLMPLSGFMNHRIRNFTLDKPFIVILRDSHASTVFQGIIYDLPGLPETTNDSQESFAPTSRVSQNLVQESTLKPNKSENLPEELGERGDADAWWIHKGKPEYLQEDKSKTISERPISSTQRNFVTKNIQLTSNNLKPVVPSTTPRFQQPEPKNPQGIRFPYPGFHQFNINKNDHVPNLTIDEGNSNDLLTLHKFHGENIGQQFAY